MVNERGNQSHRVLDRWFGCPAIFLLGLLRKSRPFPESVKSVGFLMFGAIGDALLASSLVHDIQATFPLAQTFVYVSDANRNLFDIVDGPSNVITAPIRHPLRALQRIRRQKHDLLIDVGQWPRISALLAALSGATFTVGFQTPGQSRHWAFDAVAKHSNSCHELNNFRELLRCIGIPSVALPRFRKDLLATRTSNDRSPYIVFHPWASGYRCYLREWPMERWIGLAHFVLDYGYDILITGGSADSIRAATLAMSIGNTKRVQILAGRASLSETSSAILNAAAAVTVNTGIMHIAALLGRPTVALHGPTNPLRWGPVGNASVVLGPGADTGCAYLNLGFEYPAAPPDCMGKISIQETVDALITLLASDR